MDEVYEKHKGMVYNIVSDYWNAVKYLGIDYEELVHIGVLGMVKAWGNYDSDKGKFNGYASFYVRGEVIRYVRDNNVGVRFSQNVKDVMWRLRRVDYEDMTVKELAECLGYSERMVKEARDCLKIGYVRSLDEEIMGLNLGGEGRDTFYSICEGSTMDITQFEVSDFLSSLTEREAFVVRCRERGLSQSEIGGLIGVSQMQVSRILRGIQDKYIANYEMIL